MAPDLIPTAWKVQGQSMPVLRPLGLREPGPDEQHFYVAIRVLTLGEDIACIQWVARNEMDAHTTFDAWLTGSVFRRLNSDLRGHVILNEGGYSFRTSQVDGFWVVSS
jgi:hypothetical protein